MFKKKWSIIAFTLVLTLILVPVAFAQDGGETTEETESWEDINFEDYDLDLTEEEIQELETELKNLYENSEDVTIEDIRDMLEEMENEEEDEDGMGEELSSSIATFKEENPEWTGQDLSAHIQEFLDEALERNKNREQNENEIQAKNKEHGKPDHAGKGKGKK